MTLLDIDISKYFIDLPRVPNISFEVIDEKKIKKLARHLKTAPKGTLIKVHEVFQGGYTEFDTFIPEDYREAVENANRLDFNLYYLRVAGGWMCMNRILFKDPDEIRNAIKTGMTSHKAVADNILTLAVNAEVIDGDFKLNA